MTNNTSSSISRTARTIALLALGVAIGWTLTATPVYGHVGETVGHLWRHIRPAADARYVNAMRGTDTARNANRLDGLDSSRFARGSIASFRQLFTSRLASPFFSVEGLGDVLAICENENLFIGIRNTSGVQLDVATSNPGPYYRLAPGGSTTFNNYDGDVETIQLSKVVTSPRRTVAMATITVSVRVDSPCEAQALVVRR